MTKNTKCLRCGAPVHQENATVCGRCHKELTVMHERAEQMYRDEYAAEVGSTEITE